MEKQPRRQRELLPSGSGVIYCLEEVGISACARLQAVQLRGSLFHPVRIALTQTHLPRPRTFSSLGAIPGPSGGCCLVGARPYSSFVYRLCHSALLPVHVARRKVSQKKAHPLWPSPRCILSSRLSPCGACIQKSAHFPFPARPK